MIPVTIFISGNDPVVRDGAEVPVVYTTMPDNVHPGSSLYIGDDKLSVVKVDHVLSIDGSQYDRTLIYCERNQPKKVSVKKAKTQGLTIKKVRARIKE